MKVPLSWLLEFVDLPTLDPDEIEAALLSLGHEVEGRDVLGVEFSNVIIAKVESVGPHPDADRIRLCRVATDSETLDVVCGAWNFDAGALIAYAQVGAELGVDEPFQITAREIRGVTSHGMICSAKELGLGDDHDGILVLDGLVDDDDIGRPFEDFLPLPDVVFDVSITPNRPDCMSMVGLARELGAFYDIAVRDVAVDVDASGEATAATVVIEDIEACPRFVAQEVDGIGIGPSPLWMQLRLQASGQRPISNVVDVTNYVMLELGHPIHAFDLDTLQDEALVIRRAGPDNSLVTLDGQDRSLEPNDIVVTDSTGPVALAGVMGGAATEVSETTTRVLIEAANWHAPSIMLTAHRLGLQSEASARFQRGVDPDLSRLAATRAAQLVAEVSGGTVRPGVVDEYPVPAQPRTVELSGRDVERLLGPEVSIAESEGLLRRLGFDVEPAGGGLAITVPTRRHDVTRPADLIEEIARLRGYDSFPDVVRRGAVGDLSHEQQTERHLRAILVGGGLSEIQTISFLQATDLTNLGFDPSDPRLNGIRVSNPLREEEGMLRTTLVPGLLKAVGRNRSEVGISFFEIGKIFLARPSSADPRIPAQPDHLGFVLAGELGPAGIHGRQRAADYYDAAGIIDLIAGSLDLDFELRATSAPGFHPGRAATVSVAGEEVGVIGEVHPAVLDSYGLEPRVVVGELALRPLLVEREPWQLHMPSAFPPLDFDLSFEAPSSLPAAELADALRQSSSDLLESVELFDEFLELGNGRKSLAFRVRLRSDDRTLTDEEMAPVREAIIAAGQSVAGVTLRGTE